jgi:hypothetical protein
LEMGGLSNYFPGWSETKASQVARITGVSCHTRFKLVSCFFQGFGYQIVPLSTLPLSHIPSPSFVLCSNTGDPQSSIHCSLKPPE